MADRIPDESAARENFLRAFETVGATAEDKAIVAAVRTLTAARDDLAGRLRACEAERDEAREGERRQMNRVMPLAKAYEDERARADRAEAALRECQGREAAAREALRTLLTEYAEEVGGDPDDAQAAVLAVANAVFAAPPRVVALDASEVDDVLGWHDFYAESIRHGHPLAEKIRARLAALPAPESAPGERRATR